MINIVYPKTSFRFQQKDDKEFIFDEIRKRWVILTPEEWVRQNFIHYLIAEKKYPAALIAVEKEIKLGELKKRCDIIIYKESKPWIIVECKEMNVPLNDKTFEQILNYNQTLDVQFLITTNGNITFGINTNTRETINALPDFI